MAMNSCSIRYVVEYKRRLAGSKILRSVQEKMTNLRAQYAAAMLCKYYEILEVIFFPFFLFEILFKKANILPLLSVVK